MKDAIDQDTLSTYFDILSAACKSSQPESTRLAALRSLECFPRFYISHSKPPKPTRNLSAILTLLHLLSDDDSVIRNVASEITSAVGESMTFAPISASIELAQSIGDTFHPQCLERNVAGLILENNVRHKLQTALQSDEELFAKERDNVWRDEIHEWGLYICILSMCWSREMSLELEVLDLGLETWAVDSMGTVREVVEVKEDTPLWWNHDVELFESVVKLFMLVEIMLRYGRGKNLGLRSSN